MKLEGKRVFLSGPMTGQIYNNVAAFGEANALVKLRGAAYVYNPAWLWLRESAEASEGRTHESYMIECIHELTRRAPVGRPYYDVLVSLPDWLTSEGATREREVAQECGIRCIDLYDLPLDVDVP